MTQTEFSMKYQRVRNAGFYLRTRKEAIFLGADLEEARITFQIKFPRRLEKKDWWIEYYYPNWFAKYCNSKDNSEAGWTGLDRSSDFLF